MNSHTLKLRLIFTSLLVSYLASHADISRKNNNFLYCDCFKKSYFLLIHLPSCYQTVCYGTVQ